MGRQPEPALRKRGRRRAPAAGLAVAVLVALGSSAVATAAAGAQGGDSTESWDVQLAINADGSVDVTERIVQVFESADRHGIERELAVRQGFDAEHDRVYTLGDVTVTSPTGAPADVTTREERGDRVVRIGDPDQTVSGRQEYVLEYRYDGVLNQVGDHGELYWNVIGPGWNQPVGAYSVAVSGPEALTAASCYAGPAGTDQPCGGNGLSGGNARWWGSAVPAESGAVTIAAALPPGAVAVAPPVLVEPADAGPSWHGLPADGPRLPLALAIAAAVGTGLGALMWRQGRDRRLAGSAVDSAFATDVTAAGVPVPLTGEPEPTVQFAPPDGIRPAQLGLIIDERVQSRDVAATIVDLAVRGHLTIEEVMEERALFGHRTDWKLTRTARPDGDLLEYERLLLDGLFEDGDVVDLGDLKQKFSARYAKVRSAIYRDALDRKWFPAHPDHLRTAARVAGLLVAAAAVAGLVWCVTTNSWGLLLLPVAAGGLAMAILAGWLPRRGPVGRGVYQRSAGFRTFIERSERSRADFAERRGLFSEYLPYAVALGSVGLWSHRFAGLSAEELGVGTWWIGAGHYGAGSAFDTGGFGAAVGSFSSSAAASLPATAGSSGGSGIGGGSAGGGGGGGGGGSW